MQAIKKGVMEMDDLVLINKADLDPDAAGRARAQITSSLRLLGQHGNPQRAEHDKAAWHPKVLQLSALSGQGVDALWTAAQAFRDLRRRSGEWESRRRQQALAWMWERIEAGLRQAFRADPQVRARLAPLSQQVADGTVVASVAARELLGLFHPGGVASPAIPPQREGRAP
jgi:LAO/AO transport system kinase